MPLDRQPMPQQAPEERIKNFKEVAIGYDAAMAANEASRCLQCKTAPCRGGCPVEVNIPEFIHLLKENKVLEAAQKIKEKNNLPAVCGRVCPQEKQCESRCVLAKKGEAVAIGRLERFAADFERAQGSDAIPEIQKKGKKVAVVGAGPAGLTAAADLALAGYDVTMFEALHKAGGVLVYGIPEFRLPKEIVASEVENIKKLGVHIVTNAVVGKSLSVDDLFEEGYEAVFVGSGAGAPQFMGIPGENLNGVYSANEYLTRINLMKAYEFPAYQTPVKVGKSVAVVGGGNVAMDAARTSLRMGAEKVYLVYRRSEDEIPARKEEFEHACEEGVACQFLSNPSRIIGDDKGWVTGIECIRMELGEPDASGRRSPVAVPGSEFVLPVDTVVIAIGNTPNPLIPRTTPGLEISKRGTIIINENGETSRSGVYAGGDIVTGAATVISAMGAGKHAAKAICAMLDEK